MDAIRGTLQPVTRNLPSPIKDFGVSLIGKPCYRSLVENIDINNTECVKLAVSKGLGIGIIGASSMVKIPQILKLVSSRDSAGISFLSYLLETAAYLVSLAYNVRLGFPFSTYGETGLILVQNVVIAVLVLNFSGRKAAAAVFTGGLAASMGLLFGKGFLDMGTLSYLQAGAGLLGVASKIPQIAAVWQQGGTGQLSAFAVFNYLAGSLSRIFTTSQEVDDKLILYGFIAGFLLNAVLAVQMIYYWNSPATKAAPRKQKEKAAYGSTTATPKTKKPTTRRRA